MNPLIELFKELLDNPNAHDLTAEQTFNEAEQKKIASATSGQWDEFKKHAILYAIAHPLPRKTK